MKNETSFNTLQALLDAHGLPQKRVKLVRHLDTDNGIDVKNLLPNHLASGQTQLRDLHDLYRNDRDIFLDYQRQQGKRKGRRPVFDTCDYIVSFLREDGGRARFVGVFRVEGKDQNRETSQHCYYILTEVAGFEKFKDKLVIKWGKNYSRVLASWLRKDVPVKVLEG